MNKMGIVIREVYRKNVFSGAFVMMVLGPILMMGVIALIGYFIGTSKAAESVGNIGVVGANQEIQAVLDQSDLGNEYTYYDDQKEAEKALNDGTVNGFIAFDSVEAPITGKYYREKVGKDIDVNQIQLALQAYQTQSSIAKLGIDPAKLAEIEGQQVNFETVNLNFSETGEVKADAANQELKTMRTGLAYVVCFVVYLFIMIYIGIISQEIATEKGSRIMEIVLSSITATQHFFGKMIGIGLVILTQLAIYIVLFFLGRFIFNQLNFDLSFLSLPFSISEMADKAMNDLLLGGLFALIGILTYSALAGFLGSLVSKIEDVNKVSTPLVLLGVVGFYIGMYALASTNNAVVKIGSLVPFFTPFVMPFRVAAETVTSSEIILSIIITMVFMVICLWMSAVFYKSNVLVTSDKGLFSTLKRSYQLLKSERKHN